MIQNAGAIFLGPYSSEPVGDYFAGPNHIIPTNGTARFSSPVDVDDFIKKSSVIYYSKEALLENGETIMELARKEGLEGHARAIEIRLRKERKGRYRQMTVSNGEVQARKADISRKTNETDIKLQFAVDGTGKSSLETDVPFLNPYA